MPEYQPSPAERMTHLLDASRATADARAAGSRGAGASARGARQGGTRGWVPDLPDPREEEAIEPPPRPRWSIALAAALAVVLLALVAVGGYVFFGRTPQATPVAASPSAPPPSVPEQVVVHVAGAVVSPGIVKVPPGSRVMDAVAAAGGFKDDAVPGAVNLARVLEDGEQIVVPTEEDARASAAAAPAPSQAPQASGKVNLNTADATALQELPGVGPATAEKILAYREENGPFATVDALDDVAGIGPKTMERLRDLVTV